MSKTLKFTKEKPILHGWYWVKTKDGMFVGEVWENWRTRKKEVFIRSDSFEVDNCKDYLWAGPISAPNLD